MGLGGISPWSLVIILVIVLLLFGTKKLKGLGGDLGEAIKGFKKSMGDDDKQLSQEESETVASKMNAEGDVNVDSQDSNENVHK